MGKNSRFVISLMLGTAAVLGVGIVSAKPMPAPELEEAVKSDWIVVGRYLGHAPVASTNGDAQKLYFRGLDAEYQVESVLKPSTDPITSRLSLKRPIHVNFAFQDGSACMPPRGFKLEADSLPSVGSRWILFLKSAYAFNHYSTYRGSYGRFSATPDNLALVKKIVEKD